MPGTPPNIFQGDVLIKGNLQVGSLTLPNSSVGDTQIAVGTLGNFINPTKMRHIYRPPYNQPNVAAVSETKSVWTTYGATGLVMDFRAGCIVAPLGAATVTFDLKKNGVSILSAVITLNNASVARTAYIATLAGGGVANLVVGDELEVVVVATAGGGTLPTGVFAFVTLQEDPF